jgi:tetratricopeptide (TPR) repeat protein
VRRTPVPILALGALLACPAAAQADFLPQSGPVQGLALGGNLVAMDDQEAAAHDNPAALAGLSRYVLSAGYQQLFAGIPGDDLGVQEISMLAPHEGPGGLGLLWDHFGADLLQQDRLRLAYGVGWSGQDRAQPWFSLGAGASLLYQRYTLTAPLAGVSSDHLSAEGGSMDLGVALRPWPWLCLGASVQDVNEPNLGVVGVDRLPRTTRWGLALDWPSLHLQATAAQSLNLDQLETQAGLQWTYPGSTLAFRGGASTSNASLGLGFAVGWLSLDYAYVWSVGAGPSGALPGSHAVALSAAWAAAPPGPRWVWRDMALQAAQQGQWEDALLFFRRALDQQPGDPELKSGLAQAQARLDLQRSASYLAAGQRAQARGDLAEAVGDFRWAAHLNPSSPECAAALASAQAGLPQGPMADPRYQARLASVLTRMGQHQPKRALEELEALRQAFPQDAALLALEGDLAAQLKKPDSSHEPAAALRSMEEALRYAGKGQAELARQAWQKVLQADPDNALARQALQEAEAKPTPVPASQQARAQELFNRGLAAYQSGDLPKAMDLWKEVLRIDPGHLDAQNNLMRARIELENKP